MIAAAGRGERLGRGEHKAFVELLGRPLVAYTLDALRACPGIDEMVLVVAPSEVERARRTLLRPDGRRTEKVVAGGAQRRASVWAGLAEVTPASDLVLVHDGARPFVTPEVVARAVEAAARHGAAVAAVPTTDTVKEVDCDHFVTTTLDRARLWLVQTPQVFRRELLIEAHQAVGPDVPATDDAALVERLGHPVKVVLGDAQTIKITGPEDLVWAERFLAHRDPELDRGLETRGGIGYDAHPFAEGRPLVLAGVRFPDERGLQGHSDADVVCHAICDALLGAAAMGDIGQHFPDSEPRLAGISSLSLLKQVAGMVRSEGWEVGNVDSVIIAERPRIAGRVAGMREALAEAMEVGVERISVKGKTTEGMGFTGRGEGIAAHAICTLRRIRGGPPRSQTREEKCTSTSQPKA